jgi:hypothetical protein
MGDPMNADDPNFPQEIPAIPEPQDNANPDPTLTPGDNGDIEPSAAPASPPWTDATASGNPDDIHPRNDLSAVSSSVNDNGMEEEDLLPPGWKATDPVNDAPVPNAANPQVRQPRGLAGEQRQAEEPVGPPSRATNEPYDDWGQSEVPYQPRTLGVIDQLLLLLADGVALWRKLLRWVRSQLPPRWQQRLTDEVMTAVALGLLVLLLALGNPLGSGKSSQPVAETSAPPAVEEGARSAPAELGTDNEPSGSSLTPEILSPEASPESSLIADIQDKVSNISRAFAVGLIQSVEVNLPANQLVVNVGENWYGLLGAQQDDVAQRIFEQVQQLDFKTLQLKDPEGTVVARDPVVGSTMVILHRSSPAELVSL